MSTNCPEKQELQQEAQHALVAQNVIKNASKKLKDFYGDTAATCHITDDFHNLIHPTF